MWLIGLYNGSLMNCLHLKVKTLLKHGLGWSKKKYFLFVEKQFTYMAMRATVL